MAKYIHPYLSLANDPMNVFNALADPTRREILCLLERGPMDATEIARRFDISQPAISKHLKRLREGALVTRTVDAQRRIYELDPTGFDQVERWVTDRRRSWEARLDNLGKFLENKHGSASRNR